MSAIFGRKHKSRKAAPPQFESHHNHDEQKSPSPPAAAEHEENGTNGHSVRQETLKFSGFPGGKEPQNSTKPMKNVAQSPNFNKHPPIALSPSPFPSLPWTSVY